MYKPTLNIKYYTSNYEPTMFTCCIRRPKYKYEPEIDYGTSLKLCDLLAKVIGTCSNIKV